MRLTLNQEAFKRAPKILLALVPIALLAAACSTSTATVPKADVESKVAGIIVESTGLAAEDVTVSCPSDLEGKVGATLTCEAVSGDATADAIVTVTSVDGDTVDFDVKTQPQS